MTSLDLEDIKLRDFCNSKMEGATLGKASYTLVTMSGNAK